MRKRPCRRVRRDGAEEKVDEEGGGAIDADVDVILVLQCVGVQRCTAIITSWVQRARGDAAGGVVEVVEFCADIGGKLGGIDAPVDDFGVGVTESTSRARGFGVVQGAIIVGVEGC